MGHLLYSRYLKFLDVNIPTTRFIYDTVLLGEYPSSIVSSRVLEDDHITIYGTSVGTISYKSTMG